MPRSFSSHSADTQAYLNERYGRYGISGEDGYNNHLSDEAKELSSDELIELMEQKDISHIVPQSKDPSQAGDIENTYLEDSSVNRSRGAQESTEEEIEAALEDQNYDVATIQREDSTWDQFTDNLESWDDSLVEEILGGSLVAGTILSGIETSKAIKNGEIALNYAPKYYTVKTGGRTLRYAAIGLSVTSGSPILVSAGVAYVIYRNQNLIIRVSNAVINFAKDKRTQQVASNIINTSATGLSALGKGAYEVATSENTKKIAKDTIQGTGLVLKETGKASYKAGGFLAAKTFQLASNERTRKAVKSTTVSVRKLINRVVNK